MKTRITELFGIDYPIVLAAMAWITNGDMVAAVSEAGGLGTIGPNAGARFVTKDVNETGERLREQINRVRAITDKPFAVNLVVGAAGLDKQFSERCVEVAIEEQIPVAVVSQGSPLAHTERLKKKGIKVIHVCAAVKHAKKAEDVGVDAVVASGTDGGGHSGFDQNTTYCLVPQIADVVKIPVIAGGGVCDGRQLTAAIALGAEGVYVGTRFIATKECPAHKNYKDVLLKSRDGDTMAIRHGNVAVPGSGNKGFAEARRGSVRLVLDDTIRRFLVENQGFIDFDSLIDSLSHPEDKRISQTAASMIYGDFDSGFVAAGQGVGLINEVLSCKEVIEKIMKEAEIAQGRLQP
ncbi:MAG: nitronate monooxygenase [Desulfatiglans sp.]|jgi:NAD(P)H-dependent flavin oxidoreductase YrpB (nitropropane dioxygenase family)|nr:nitronate monooxygenase [Thermodesulfobacteriota bacterium]MEE4351925.1 nitronate monooxygenase [Desulfatiglans sp.]